MITCGSSALQIQDHSRQEEMVEYLSAEGGYWISNDVWRTDSPAYRVSGIGDPMWQGVLADFSEFSNEDLKIEIKYYLLYCMKTHIREGRAVQNLYQTAIRLIGSCTGQSDDLSSFEDIDLEQGFAISEDTSPAVRKIYGSLLKDLKKFFQEFYDDREEMDRDVWRALRVPGAKLSAAMKRTQPIMDFTDVPEEYRPMVKRFMKRLVIRRSWSYCHETLMYIRYFFTAFYSHGYSDGFLEKLSRKDVENYLQWVAEDYEGNNATFRSKAVSFIRSWLDYIQIAEYPQAPEKSIERLIFDEDIPPRERAADTIEKVRYIPAPVIQQLDADIDQIEPAEMRPVYILLRESGWRGTDILNLRYDTCLQYIWNEKEKRSVPYLCGEITKVGIPELKDPIRDEVAEMVKLLAKEAGDKSTEENNPDRYLFNCYEGRCMGLPYSKPAFSRSVQKVIDKNDIRDTDGSLFHFRAHGLRHTRAMEYAEQGMPIGIIQRLLGHCSLQMTLHYARVSEDTLYQKWKSTEKLELFKPVTAPPMAKENRQDGEIHFEKVRENLDAVRVPFGVCFKPSKVGCRRQTEQCMECPSFCSTTENLDEYAEEIDKVREMIRIGETLGRSDWIEKNKEYLSRLEAVRARVEKDGIVHKSGSMREN